jgi:hypothetical protein
MGKNRTDLSIGPSNGKLASISAGMIAAFGVLVLLIDYLS